MLLEHTESSVKDGPLRSRNQLMRFARSACDIPVPAYFDGFCGSFNCIAAQSPAILPVCTDVLEPFASFRGIPAI